MAETNRLVLPRTGGLCFLNPGQCVESQNKLVTNQHSKGETRSRWTRYRQTISFKSDLKAIFLRSHKRHATLDGARAITILLLVLFHTLYGVVRLLQPNTENMNAFFEAFPEYLNWMWQTQGSDPLFVISGLLVSLTIFREMDKTGTLDIRRYFKRRLLRIYPLFIFALLIFLLADNRGWSNLLANLFFMSNLVPGNKPIIPVGWSLEVQMQFYLLLPFLCLALHAVRWPVALLAGLSISAVVYRYWVVVSNPEFVEKPFYTVVYESDFANLLADNLYYDLDVRIGGFLMGVLVAHLFYYHGKVITVYFKRHLLANAVVLLLALYLIIWSFGFPVINPYADVYNDFTTSDNFWYLVLNRYVYSLGMSVLLVLVLCPAGLSSLANWVFSWPIWHPVGELIYPIYLFHFPFIVLAAVVVFGTTDSDSITAVSIPSLFAIFFVTVAFTIIFSALVHVFIEKPFLRLRGN